MCFAVESARGSIQGVLFNIYLWCVYLYILYCVVLYMNNFLYVTIWSGADECINPFMMNKCVSQTGRSPAPPHHSKYNLFKTNHKEPNSIYNSTSPLFMQKSLCTVAQEGTIWTSLRIWQNWLTVMVLASCWPNQVMTCCRVHWCTKSSLSRKLHFSHFRHNHKGASSFVESSTAS